MLSQEQVDFVEHLVATATKLPARFPLISAGEFVRRMSACLPAAIPCQPAPAETAPLRVCPNQSQSQQRRWAAHNAASEQRAVEYLSTRGPLKIVELAIGINVGVPRAYQLAKKLRLEKLADGRYRLPKAAERLAS